jgi:hypothetical protein
LGGNFAFVATPIGQLIEFSAQKSDQTSIESANRDLFSPIQYKPNWMAKQDFPPNFIFLTYDSAMLHERMWHPLFGFGVEV